MSEQDELLLIEIAELSRDLDNFCKTLYDNNALSFCRNGCPRQTECYERRSLLAKAKQHYEQKTKGTLEEIESRWGWAFDKNVWRAYKQEVLEEIQNEY